MVGDNVVGVVFADGLGVTFAVVVSISGCVGGISLHLSSTSKIVPSSHWQLSIGSMYCESILDFSLLYLHFPRPQLSPG